MTRILLVAMVVAASTGPAGAAANGAAAKGAATNPSVRLPGSSPVVVTGAHFRAHGTVKVTVSYGGTKTLSVKTTAGGTFSLTFPHLRLATCGKTVQIQALGARGESATLQVGRHACGAGAPVGVTATAPDGTTVSG